MQKIINTKLNLCLPINTVSFGIAGLNLLKSLTRLGYEPALFPIHQIEAPQSDHPIIKEALDRQGTYDTMAPSLRLWHASNLAEHIGRGPRVGFTIFEIDRLSDREIHHINDLDLILTSSKYHVEVIKKFSKTVVGYVPLGVDREIFNENVPIIPEISANNQIHSTRFLHIGKAEYRKGLDVILEGFNKAFTPKDNVELHLVIYNPFIGDGNQEWANKFKECDMGDRIVIWNRLPTQSHVASVMRSCDCLLAPSRAEGFNFEAVEAMSCGLSVVITNCTAHSDYANADNSYLIEMDGMEVARDDTPFFQGQGNWYKFGEPQMEQFINYLRSIHTLKSMNLLSVNASGIETAKRLSWRSATQTMMEFING